MREIKAMKTFYTSEFNHKGRPGKMTMTTKLKLIKRLVTFMSLWASKLEMTPSLALEKDLLLVESFISHLRMDRWMQNSIAACYIQSLVTTPKFLGADQRYGDLCTETSMGQSKSLHNVVVISDNPVWLVEMRYKTVAKYGPNVVQFNQEFDFLTHHLSE